MKILFVSLGCDKNLVDSEKMLGLLVECGYEITNDEAEAEIIVVNTCGFISDAKEESIDTILEFADLKENGILKALIVTGCLSQRYKEELLKEIPEIDAMLGIREEDDLLNAIDEVINKGNKGFMKINDKDAPLKHIPHRIVTTGGHYAYLKIAEGCDKHCTYCIIPDIRGNYRSYKMEDILKEAEDLVNRIGVKEVILVAQETTLYGVDLYGKKMLPELLTRLCAIGGLKWIRLLYCYPEEITDELLDVIAREVKICHYLDIPIQHGSDQVLRRMGRRTTQAEIRERIEAVRTKIPDICLRTTFITGFPGETQEDFEELYRFVNEMEFDRLGVFPYSQEEDTPAAEMKEQISMEVKEDRRNEIMELQQEIAFEKAESKAGMVLEVMVEGKLSEENVFVGRTYMDAPDVDGYVFIRSSRELYSGDFVRVKVTGSHEYDLIGELVDEYSE